MASLLSLLLSASILSIGQAPEPRRVAVTFEITVPADTAGSVYLAADVADLGAWRPDGLLLVRGDDGKYRATARLTPGTTVLFKFTRGTWITEETRSDGSPVDNRTYVIPEKDVTVPVTVRAWRDVTRRPAGLDTGRIRRHDGVKATRLGNERTVFVLLPRSYETSRKTRYPVIYAHDGQNMFASVTGSGMWDWNADGVLDRLVDASVAPEAIIVGPFSTEARVAEYDPLSRGPDYADFLINDLKPFIDRTYRTMPDREHTSTIGSSMGGLIACYLVLEHSSVFSRAACLSIHVIHPMDTAQSGAWVRKLEAGVPKHKTVRLYVDRGTAGLDGRYGPLFNRLVALLEKAGFERGPAFDVHEFDGADHNEEAWASRLEHPLRFLLEK